MKNYGQGQYQQIRVAKVHFSVDIPFTEGFKKFVTQSFSLTASLHFAQVPNGQVCVDGALKPVSVSVSRCIFGDKYG